MPTKVNRLIDLLERTELFYANSGASQELISQGADPAHPDVNGDTPLHIASVACDLDKMKVLLEAGAEVDAKNLRGRTPLNAILFNCRFADINAIHEDCIPTYHGLPEEKVIAAIIMLCERGADVRAECHDGMSPLSYVKDSSHSKLVKALIPA